MFAVRREIVPLVTTNRSKLDAVDAYAEVVQATMGGIELEAFDGAEASGVSWAGEDVQGKRKGRELEPSECVTDVREYDVNYYQRVAIDLGQSQQI